MARPILGPNVRVRSHDGNWPIGLYLIKAINRAFNKLIYNSFLPTEIAGVLYRFGGSI